MQIARDIFLYLFSGALAGLLSGMFGIGGGIVIVPCLALLFSLLHMAHPGIMQMAAGTSFAIMIATAASSIAAYQHMGGVNWVVCRRMLPGVIVGTLLGVELASYLHSDVLRFMFGVFLLLAAVQMFLQVAPHAHRQVPGFIGLSGFGLLVGANSGLLGIGGGMITVPYLTYYNMSLREAAGVSIVCGLVIAVIGTIGFIVTGLHAPNRPPGSIGYIYWPAFVIVSIASLTCAPIGAKLAMRIPMLIGKRIFSVILFIISVRMML